MSGSASNCFHFTGKKKRFGCQKKKKKVKVKRVHKNKYSSIKGKEVRK